MLNYLFLQELFKNILAHSKTIRGRFITSPRYGGEINTDNLEQIIQELATDKIIKEYPLALLLPPKADIEYLREGSWENYQIILFFLTPTYYSSATKVHNTKWPNKSTGTSRHSIIMDWYDMRRAALDFLRVLDSLSLVPTEQPLYRIVKGPVYIDPASLQGVDRVSGVRLQFNMQIWTGCELEDYEEIDIAKIIIPKDVKHPIHEL